MKKFQAYLSVFPDTTLVSSFINTLKLTHGGVQSQDTLQEPTMRKMFQCVCYLKEIDHQYEKGEEIPNIKIFMEEGIQKLKEFILTTFPDEFGDDEDIQGLDYVLQRSFVLPNSLWVYCIYCESRMKYRNPSMGDVCELCGSWWLLRSLKNPNADYGVHATKIHNGKRDITCETDSERIENEDRILTIMNPKVMYYENLILKMHPFYILVGVPSERECPVCYATFDRDPIALGKECKMKDSKFDNPHMIHFECHETWFQQQITQFGLEKATCPARYNHPLDFSDFMNKRDLCSFKFLWKICGKRRKIKNNRG